MLRKGGRIGSSYTPSKCIFFFLVVVPAILLWVTVQEATDADLKPSGKNLNVAVFLQVGYSQVWDDLLMCTTNIISAAALRNYQKVDVFVSVISDVHKPFYDTPPLLSNAATAAGKIRSVVTDNLSTVDPTEMIKTDLENLPNVGRVIVTKTYNIGLDIGAFMRMLKDQMKGGTDSQSSYDVILKMHSKRDNDWRERSVESLCGTQEQVLSVFQHFRKDPALDLVAPIGTVFGPKSELSDVYPLIRKKYNWQKQSDLASAFDPGIHKKMNSIHKMMFPSGISDTAWDKTAKNIPFDELGIVAGSMFWIRYSALHAKELISMLPRLEPDFTKGYMENGGVEHAIERLFVTEIALRKRKVAEIAPAPRVVAMFFPQFHPIPENDRFWGKGFTEWTILKPLEMKNIRKPLSVDKGGLGFYDLMSKDTRKAQADMARQYGVNGFIYYHYWFSGTHAPDDHLVMHQVQEQMLLDGEPNLPFAFSWANEPWVKRWSGIEEDNGDTLLSQDYGDEKEWREHFEYLLKFFRHPNYIKIQGKPVFIIYRIGHVGSKMKPMLDLWRELAMDAGIPGIHFVNTIGNFRTVDKDTVKNEKEGNFDAAFHFWPQLFASFDQKTVLRSDTSSRSDIQSLLETYPTQYWGAFTGFDARPRKKDAKPYLRSPEDFDKGLECSFEGMSGNAGREIHKNLFFVTAWNEWNEQALMEPDDVKGFSYLQATQTRLSEFPISISLPRAEKEKDSYRREHLKNAKCQKEENN